jgi:hypothetical protein
MDGYRGDANDGSSDESPDEDHSRTGRWACHPFSTCPGAPSRSGSSPPPWNCICILHGIGIGHQLQHLGGVCDWGHLAIGVGAGRPCCCCPVPVHACLLWSVGLAV